MAQSKEQRREGEELAMVIKEGGDQSQRSQKWQEQKHQRKLISNIHAKYATNQAWHHQE